MKPKVLVIISSFNQGQYIEQCIKSIQNQSYQNFDFKVIDNNSTDNTYEILKKIKCEKHFMPLKYLCRLGLSNTLCIGLARFYHLRYACNMADIYKYVAIVDADDYWRYDKLEKQVEMLEKTKSNICFSDCYFHYERHKNVYEEWPIIAYDIDTKIGKKTYLEEINFKEKYLENPFFYFLSKGNFAPCPTLMFRTEFLKDRTQPSYYSAAEDYELLLRMANESNNFCYVNEPLAYYRRHINQLTQKKRVRCSLEEIDCVKRFSKYIFNNTQRWQISFHLAWLYIKLAVKELIETEEYLRENK